MPTQILLLFLTVVLLFGCGDSSREQSAARSQFLAATVSTVSQPSFPGNRNQYSILKTDLGYTVRDISGASGYKLLSGAQSIRFADVTVNLTIAAKASAVAAADLKTLIELYIAYFNRAPDADGLVYWIDRLKAGDSLDSIGSSFYAAALQFSDLTGMTAASTDADFVKTIYKNVLGRSTPDQEGFNYWVNRLGAGTSTRGSLVRSILGSAHGFKGDATYGSVADLLDNKFAVAYRFAVLEGLNYNSQAESISKGMAILSNVTAAKMEAGIAMIAALTDPSPATGTLCQTTPSLQNIGAFRTYDGDCIVSYQVSAADFQALSSFDSSSAGWTQIGAVQQNVTVKVQQAFDDVFDTIFYVWDIFDRPPLAPYGFYSSANTCAQIDCQKFLGTMTIPFSNDGIRNGPLLHEILHQYANKGLPTTNAAHWGFSSVGGQLGGWNSQRFTSLGNGQYHAAATLPFWPGTPQATMDAVSAQLNAFGEIASGGNMVPYAPLELYSMGLIPAAEVPDIQVAMSPLWIDQAKGNFSATGFTKYTADDYGNLMAKAGYPKPDMSKARRTYRALVVVLTDKPQISSTVSALLTKSIGQFTKQGIGDDFWSKNGSNIIHNFWMATGGRATYSMNRSSEFRKYGAPKCSLTTSTRWIGPGEQVNLTASCGPAANSYVWTNANIGSSAYAGTVSLAATTTISVQGTNEFGTSETASVTIQVIPGFTKLPEGFVWLNGQTWAPPATDAWGSWDQASSYCATSTINGQTGWRLPTRTELSDLVKSGYIAGDSKWQYHAWTSTAFAPGNYAIVDLQNGTIYGSIASTTSRKVCVR